MFVCSLAGKVQREWAQILDLLRFPGGAEGHGSITPTPSAQTPEPHGACLDEGSFSPHGRSRPVGQCGVSRGPGSGPRPAPPCRSRSPTARHVRLVLVTAPAGGRGRRPPARRACARKAGPLPPPPRSRRRARRPGRACAAAAVGGGAEAAGAPVAVPLSCRPARSALPVSAVPEQGSRRGEGLAAPEMSQTAMSETYGRTRRRGGGTLFFLPSGRARPGPGRHLLRSRVTAVTEGNGGAGSAGAGGAAVRARRCLCPGVCVWLVLPVPVSTAAPFHRITDC